MNKIFLTNPVTGKIIKNSNYTLLNLIKKNFKGEYINLQKKENQVSKKIVTEENLTDEEYLKKYYFNYS